MDRASHIIICGIRPGVNADVLHRLSISCIGGRKHPCYEDLLRQVEKEEERLSYSEPDKQCFHLCIINLVIGTLYCGSLLPCAHAR